MENKANVQRKLVLRSKLNKVTTKIAIVATPVLLSSAAFAEEIVITPADFAITGLGVAAASVFAIKASPSMMMWGYRKILGFIGR